MFGSFLLCPCHLPVTLTALAFLAGGTVVGSFIRSNPLLVGTATTALWLAGMWRGVRLLRASKGAVDTARRLDPVP